MAQNVTSTNQPAPAVVPSTNLPAHLPATNIAAALPRTNLVDGVDVSSMEKLDDKHHLAIGDRVSFKILEDQEDISAKPDPRAADPWAPLPMIVTDAGDLEIPYIGRFPAANKTCRQLAKEIKTELEKDYYYQATVIISIDFKTTSRGKVYLVGPIRLPGPQEIPSSEILTISKAILRAGGFTDFADRKHVKITRKSEASDAAPKTILVDLTEIIEGGRTDKDIPLEAGDMIVVPERLIRF